MSRAMLQAARAGRASPEPQSTVRLGHTATIAIAGPPDLPPILTARRKRRDDDPVIMPDILRIDMQSKVIDRANNWITIHYFWMNRVWGFFDRCEVAHVNSRRYHQWLETYHFVEGVPPHIQFGGAIEAGERDPTFYPRWLAYARREFC